jgi:hypothetical protein
VNKLRKGLLFSLSLREREPEQLSSQREDISFTILSGPVRKQSGAMKKTRLISLPITLGVMLALLLSILVLPAVAKNKADIADIVISKERESLEVSFRILNCFTPKMEEAIRSGVSTSFRILVELEKPGMAFFRSKSLNFSLEHTIKYDRLRNVFKVTLPEHPDGVVVTKDFDEAKVWMSCVKELPVIPLWRLQKKELYQLRLKAELSKFRLPLFFRYIFFFVSLWDFETDWHQVTLTQ